MGTQRPQGQCNPGSKAAQERTGRKADVIRAANAARDTLDAAPETGGLAQLARAPALQAGGQRFESVILHDVRLKSAHDKESIIDILRQTKLRVEQES